MHGSFDGRPSLTYGDPGDHTHADNNDHFHGNSYDDHRPTIIGLQHAIRLHMLIW